MKFIKISQLFITLCLLSSCKMLVEKDQQINTPNDKELENINTIKSKIEIRFSCGEDKIKEYIDDGWTILEENTQEKICTWKSVPATKDCDMNKDKGCKITKPDKIGEERIYLLEK